MFHLWCRWFPTKVRQRWSGDGVGLGHRSTLSKPDFSGFGIGEELRLYEQLHSVQAWTCQRAAGRQLARRRIFLYHCWGGDGSGSSGSSFRQGCTGHQVWCATEAEDRTPGSRGRATREDRLLPDAEEKTLVAVYWHEFLHANVCHCSSIHSSQAFKFNWPEQRCGVHQMACHVLHCRCGLIVGCAYRRLLLGSAVSPRHVLSEMVGLLCPLL